MFSASAPEVGLVYGVDDVVVSYICTPIQYTISGTVEGIPHGESITILYNGMETLDLHENGAWPENTGLILNQRQISWPTTAEFHLGMDYEITVDESSLPDHIQCPEDLSHGLKGTNYGSDIDNVHIVCSSSGN